ncbi:MAG: hypothetical protein AAF328_02325 [Planctomycetota bacterium]
MNDPLIQRLMIGSLVALAGVGGFAWFVQMLGREGNPYGQALSWLLGWLGWSVVGLVVFVPVTMMLGIITPLLGVMSPLVAMMLVVLVGHAAWLRRRRRGFTVLSVLDQATRQHLPIPGVLRAAALGEGRAMRTKLNRLAGWVEDGGGIGAGLEQWVPELPAAQRAVVVAGERTGRLPETLSGLRRDDLDAMRGDGSGGAATWMGVAYGMTVTATTLAMVSFMTLIIFPKFIEIFDDFGTAMPWATRMTFRVFGGGAYERHGGVGAIPVLLLLIGLMTVALTLGASLRMCGTSGGSMGRGAASVLRGWAGALPVLGMPLHRGAWARSYAAMASSLQAGATLQEAAGVAGVAAADRRVERRWTRFGRAVASGASAQTAARKACLPQADRRVLALQDLRSDLQDAAQFLATRHDAARQRAAAALRSMVLPMVVVLLGGLVGWISYAMFAPLVVLIEAMTPEWTVR